MLRTGKIVALADKKNLQVHDLKIKDFQIIDKRINKNIFEFITLSSSVKNRKSKGGTSPDNIKKELVFSKEKWLKC